MLLFFLLSSLSAGVTVADLGGGKGGANAPLFLPSSLEEAYVV